MRPPEQLPIALTFADGTLGVMYFVTTEYNADGSIRWERRATDDAIAAEVAKTAIPWPGKAPIQAWERTTVDALPKDRTFRDAWRLRKGGRIEHDMDHVRAIHLVRLRRRRDARLAELDREWTRAHGQKNEAEVERVEAERQRLRDLPATLAPALEAATTPEAVARLDLAHRAP